MSFMDNELIDCAPSFANSDLLLMHLYPLCVQKWYRFSWCWV